MRLDYISLTWWILFLPLLSAAFITLFTLRSRNLSSLISIGAVVAGFIMTVLFIHANGFQVNVGNHDQLAERRGVAD